MSHALCAELLFTVLGKLWGRRNRKRALGLIAAIKVKSGTSARQNRIGLRSQDRGVVHEVLIKRVSASKKIEPAFLQNASEVA